MALAPVIILFLVMGPLLGIELAVTIMSEKWWLLLHFMFGFWFTMKVTGYLGR